VSGGALALALGAAFLHATWNVLLAGSRDSVAATGALLLYGTILLAPPALLGGGVSGQAVPFVAASAALELLYFVLLARAYREGELGVVYPTARGSAPVFVLVAALLGLGKGVSELAALGVVLVAAGILVVFPGRPALWPHEGPYPGRPRRDLAFGVAIGATIAAYTLVDSRGIQHADPFGYLELVMAGPAFVYLAAVVARKGTAPVRSELTVPTVLAAAASLGAYALALAALELASAASVAAVRETSVVIAVALAAPVLREQVGARRLGGSVLVASGIALLSF
jgi:uncharacterized membrane protein